jgi:hypothetical protein
MFTLMGGLAAMVAIMQAAMNAEQMTRCALSPAKLRVRSHFDDHIIESPA